LLDYRCVPSPPHSGRNPLRPSHHLRRVLSFRSSPTRPGHRLLRRQHHRRLWHRARPGLARRSPGRPRPAWLPLQSRERRRQRQHQQRRRLPPEFGGNDGLRGLPIADTRRNLDTIVSTLVHSGSKVILAGITLPPNYGSDYIKPFDETYRLIASRYHVPLLPMLYANVYTVTGAIQQDGVHPTAKGAQLLTENFLPLLLPLLHK
jgi:hypothetical protein